MGLVKEAKQLLKRYKKSHNPFPGPDFHHKFMIEYGKIRHKHKKDFDFKLYKTAVWLHDIGRFSPEDKTGESRAEREYHKKLGARIFDREFAHLVKDSLKREKIRECILKHSGKTGKIKYIELQVIREADRISFLHPKYTKWLVKAGQKKMALASLKKNYNELLKINPTNFALEVAKDWKTKSEKNNNL